MIEFTHEYAEHFYHTPNALEKHSGAIPIRIGYNEAKPNYHIGPRFIAYYSLHFVHAGQVTLRIDQEEIVLKQGGLFALFPNSIHEYYITPCEKPALRMFWIAAEGKQMPSITSRLGLTLKHPYIENFFNQDLEQSFFQFAHEWKHLVKQDDLSLTQAFYSLLNQIVRLSKPIKASSQTDDWLTTSLDYIHLYYKEGITITDIADHVGIHRSHFSNVFHQKVGIRPHRYLTNLIMQEALRIVNTTLLPISHIALSLGYSDIYSFTHAFKSYHGQPPSSYRKS
ncbi:AraC family transcriptional regulator [Paenibacillus sp. 2TAB23]|uniref:helix-turn-helix transcriptional regulator n=1 Tax=Paenibacillus sp. 2TAB23 TaxID=3233004 RepID=UPI003F9D2A55